MPLYFYVYWMDGIMVTSYFYVQQLPRLCKCEVYLRQYLWDIKISPLQIRNTKPHKNLTFESPKQLNASSVSSNLLDFATIGKCFVCLKQLNCSQFIGFKKCDDEFAQKSRGELGWPAGNKQATKFAVKFAANFQLSVSLIDLGIYLSFLLRFGL